MCIPDGRQAVGSFLDVLLKALQYYINHTFVYAAIGLCSTLFKLFNLNEAKLKCVLFYILSLFR